MLKDTRSSKDDFIYSLNYWPTFFVSFQQFTSPDEDLMLANNQNYK